MCHYGLTVSIQPPPTTRAGALPGDQHKRLIGITSNLGPQAVDPRTSAAHAVSNRDRYHPAPTWAVPE